MKILFLLILIISSIVRAVRKAQREQQRRAATAPIARGPVIEDDSHRIVMTEPSQPGTSDRWRIMSQEADRFVDEVRDEVPEEIKPLLEKPRRATRRDIPVLETVYEYEQAPPSVLPPVPDAYAQPADAVRRGISFDRRSLRTFFVTREVLGPPRSRSPYRPGVRK